ncbi:MATN2 [Branchiostoma lanceolatum]|uniref:MATN2 protein n=1 Tax=Branchiostoma lanceolatum TaxID=7740 RepID=A0A8J9YW70_BRALA|nr:MATN2 [Branchiostoma lanceolatum]
MGSVQNPATYRFVLDPTAHTIGVSCLRRTSLRREDRAGRGSEKTRRLIVSYYCQSASNDSTTTDMLEKLLLTTAVVVTTIQGSSAQGTCDLSSFNHVPQTDCSGGDLASRGVVTLQACADDCCADSACQSFQHNINGECYLKSRLCSAGEKASSSAGNMYDRIPAVCSADIVLTLDMSSSIPQAQFNLAKNFMLAFIECAAFQGKDIRIGVILYNCVPRTYFDLGKYTRNSSYMRGAIHYMMRKGGETRTGVAIRHMKDTSDFRDGVPVAAVIFTDGQTSDDYAYEAGAARAAGIDLYAVGVGYPPLVDQTALETITDYSDRVLDKTQACVAAQKIMDDLCGG